MKMKMFAVYDSKVEAYGMMHFARSKGEALRNFMDEANKGTSDLNKHSEDYSLFEIGEFCQIKGEFEALATKRSLGCAREFKKDAVPIGAVGQGFEKD